MLLKIIVSKTDENCNNSICLISYLLNEFRNNHFDIFNLQSYAKEVEERLKI